MTVPQSADAMHSRVLADSEPAPVLSLSRAVWRRAVYRSASLPDVVKVTLIAHSERGRGGYHDDSGNLHALTVDRLSRARRQSSRTTSRHLSEARRLGWIVLHGTGSRGQQQVFHYSIPGDPVPVCCDLEGCHSGGLERVTGSSTLSPGGVSPLLVPTDIPQHPLRGVCDVDPPMREEVTVTERAIDRCPDEPFVIRNRQHRRGGGAGPLVCAATPHPGSIPALEDDPHQGDGMLPMLVSVQQQSVTDRVSDAVDGFEQWWSLWPKKRDKGNARKAYLKALKHADPQVLYEALVVQLGALKQAESRGGFCPYPATWLNGERWLDDMTEPSVIPQGRGVNVAQHMLAQMMSNPQGELTGGWS